MGLKVAIFYKIKIFTKLFFESIYKSIQPNKTTTLTTITLKKKKKTIKLIHKHS